MAIKSGSGRASLILANETRSGLRDREGNGQLLPGEMRRVRAVLRIGTDEDGDRDGRTGTLKAARARDETEELRNRRQGDARQPCILSWGVPGYNPSSHFGRTGGARVPRQGKGGLPASQGSWSEGQVRAGIPPCPALRPRSYLISTVAPAPSRAALAFSASSLLAFSRTGLGAASTRSLASLRPRLVRARTSLMTWIFLSPAAVRMTSKSDFSSSPPPASPPAAGAAAAATATGAAAVTPNFSSKSFNNSLSWITESSAIPSRISSLVRVAICLAFLSLLRSWLVRLRDLGLGYSEASSAAGAAASAGASASPAASTGSAAAVSA